MFDDKRRAVLASLGFDPERATVTRNADSESDLVALFLHLLDLPDATLFAVIAIVMGETLASGSALVDALGSHIGVAMAD